MKMKMLFLPLLLASGLPAQAKPVSAAAIARLPLKQNGGTWQSGHVQGIAVDTKGGYIYYSFTNLLAKYDLSGKLVGTLVGWTGHLGDLAFNPADGRVYGSLEYKDDNAFYIAVIDVDQLDRVGIEASETPIFRTVYLPEVAKDYAAVSPEHRYGCSGIDGVAFGPAFGRVEGPSYLTVAYGIFGDTQRSDNDHQVLLQYDTGDWARQARPLSEAKPHRNGPAIVQGKYFVRTGNTTYGVQNLSYDDFSQRWFMGVYKGTKPSFPNFRLFAVDARSQPARGDLAGVPGPDGKGWEKGLLIPLAEDGLKDEATGIRGWDQKADMGFQPVGHGLYYLSANSSSNGRQSADITLMQWTGDARQPFAPITTEELNRLSRE